MPRLSPVVLALSLVAAVVAIPAEAAQRAFVSSSGNDANTASGCGLAAPCRSFASAQTVVNDGGEIIALDAAGYGPITITKSVTITANPGFHAGITVASGTGVTIDTAGISVTLRGLTIKGIGGSVGVYMTNGAQLSIENCVISNFSGTGVVVNFTAAKVRIIDSLIRDNGYGVYAAGGPTAVIASSKIIGNSSRGIQVAAADNTTTIVAVNDTVLAGNVGGIDAASIYANATVRVFIDRATITTNSLGVVSQGAAGSSVATTLSNSTVTGNPTAGLYQVGDATLESLGNNTVRYNGANVGTITPVSPM